MFPKLKKKLLEETEAIKALEYENKKPIKMIKKDEENKEQISEISYYQCVEKNEKPNRIF